MPRIKYIEKNFRRASLDLIQKCNVILRKYAAAGYDMTLRQLYYQLVAADEIPNTPQSYDNIGSLINDARLAGLTDWNYLVDRTRNLQSLAHWQSPESIIDAVADQYRIDKWAKQTYRPEVWIEKEALAGVFERVCNELDVSYFSCRGYTSQSEMWRAAQRLEAYRRANQIPVILHFGDHDPSGIDMTRDIDDRLQLFMGGLKIQRLALNMDQIEHYAPPPNPAKVTDSRAAKYIEIYGRESWELDALDPETLSALVRDAITSFRDDGPWNDSVNEEKRQRAELRAISNNYSLVSDFVSEWTAEERNDDTNEDAGNTDEYTENEDDE
jgi:hypothetical protein